MHVGATTDDEEIFYSKIGVIDATRELRGSAPLPWWQAPLLQWFAPNLVAELGGQTYVNAATRTFGASGLAGVWAEENTRESIYDAFRRRETFTTSGSRIRIRFFAGNDLDKNLLDDPHAVRRATAHRCQRIHPPPKQTGSLVRLERNFLQKFCSDAGASAPPQIDWGHAFAAILVSGRYSLGAGDSPGSSRAHRCCGNGDSLAGRPVVGGALFRAASRQGAPGGRWLSTRIPHRHRWGWLVCYLDRLRRRTDRLPGR